MFIVSLNYKVRTELVDQHLAAHSEFLKKQYALGYFLLSGRKIPRTGGIILAEVENRQILDHILAEDPFWVNEVADYQVIEIQPTMASPKLKLLLKQSK